MAKQTRTTKARSSKPSREKLVASGRRASTPGTAVASARRIREQEAAAPTAPAARKPAYYEAIAIYEAGVRALQRRDFRGAAGHFRSVIERFPDERELLERARLYLQVCERETATRPAGPSTPQERVYAATVALNAGDADSALTHLKRALTEDPGNDYAHYIMAVALCERRRFADALNHLRQSIQLNPENRSNARFDPDLTALRETAGCRDLLDAASQFARRRLKTNR